MNIPRYKLEKILDSQEIKICSFEELYKYRNLQRKINRFHRASVYHVFRYRGEYNFHYVENRKIKLANNDLLVINKDILQKYSVCKSTGDTIIFSPAFFGNTQEKIDFLNRSTLFQNDYTVIKSQSESFFTSVEFYFSSMRVKTDKVEETYLSLLRNWLHNLLMTLEREYNLQKQFYHWDSQNNTDEIREFRILLNKHYHEQKQVRFYAEKLNISERKLSRTVYIVYGISAKKYIKEKVLSEAVRLIKNTTLTQGEIANKLGLDFTYFVKFFRKYYGITPARYRKKGESW